MRGQQLRQVPLSGLGELLAPSTSQTPDPWHPGALSHLPFYSSPSVPLQACCSLSIPTHWYLLFNALEKFPPGAGVARAPQGKSFVSPLSSDTPWKRQLWLTPSLGTGLGWGLHHHGGTPGMACLLLPPRNTAGKKGILWALCHGADHPGHPPVPPMPDQQGRRRAGWCRRMTHRGRNRGGKTRGKDQAGRTLGGRKAEGPSHPGLSSQGLHWEGTSSIPSKGKTGGQSSSTPVQGPRAPRNLCQLLLSSPASSLKLPQPTGLEQAPSAEPHSPLVPAASASGPGPGGFSVHISRGKHFPQQGLMGRNRSSYP